MVEKDSPGPPSGFWRGTEVSTKLESAATLVLKTEVISCITPEVKRSGVISTVPTVININNPKIKNITRNPFQNSF